MATDSRTFLNQVQLWQTQEIFSQPTGSLSQSPSVILIPHFYLTHFISWGTLSPPLSLSGTSITLGAFCLGQSRWTAALSFSIKFSSRHSLTFRVKEASLFSLFRQSTKHLSACSCSCHYGYISIPLFNHSLVLCILVLDIVTLFPLYLRQKQVLPTILFLQIMRCLHFNLEY